MEAISHTLMGIIVQQLCFIFFQFPFNIIMTIILAFFSHFLIDALAKFTYHTPEPHKEDRFWVIWHIITPILFFLLIIWGIFIEKFLFFLLGGIFASLVDIIDWGIIRPYFSKKQKESGEIREKPYILHRWIDYIREKIPPFAWLPNLNEDKRGVITEIVTIVVLWTSVIFLL